METSTATITATTARIAQRALVKELSELTERCGNIGTQMANGRIAIDEGEIMILDLRDEIKATIKGIAQLRDLSAKLA